MYRVRRKPRTSVPATGGRAAAIVKSPWMAGRWRSSMGDGLSEEILKRVEDHVLRVEKKVDNITKNGCAHRPDDLRRTENIEQWQKSVTNKFIGILLGIIASLATGFYSIFK
jgi:hypothetical protein